MNENAQISPVERSPDRGKTAEPVTAVPPNTRSIHRHLYDLEDRLQERLYWLQRRLKATEKKIDRLAAENQAQRNQRNILLVLTVLFAVAFYFSLHRFPKLPSPSLPSQNVQPQPQSSQKSKVAPQHSAGFFGSTALARSPNKGERVLGRGQTYPITDTYRIRMVHPATGERSPPYCAGKSPEQADAQKLVGCIVHRGVDVGTPVGTPVFAIALPQTPARVECRKQPPWGTYGEISSPSLPHWRFIAHHLKTCNPGMYLPGQAFGTTGTAGTGPHLHFGSKYRGAWVTPPLGFIQWMLTGEQP